MATVNPFDLLVDDDNDDPSHLIALAQKQKEAAAAAAVSTGGKKHPAAAAAAASAPAKMPTKPVPPSQAVREARNVTNAPARGGGRGGPGRGRGGRGAGIGSNRDFGDRDANGFRGGYGGGGGNGGGVEDRDGNRNSERSRGEGYGGSPRQGFRGGRRGGYGNGGDGEEGGEVERAPRRVYERRSGTGRSYEMKREGAGRGNWGTVSDDVIAQEIEENVNPDEKVVVPEKQLETEDGKLVEGDKENKDNAANEEVKPEDKEMTLDEYEKIKEEKRKALLAMKSEERKVSIDKELESMQQLSLKKGNEEIFVKLGTDKGSKRRENADHEERVKKSLSINEFLKPAEGEKYYSPGGGRGRGRGRGDRGPFRGGFGGGPVNTPAAPAIADPGQFPTLGGK